MPSVPSVDAGAQARMMSNRSGGRSDGDTRQLCCGFTLTYLTDDVLDIAHFFTSSLPVLICVWLSCPDPHRLKQWRHDADPSSGSNAESCPHYSVWQDRFIERWTMMRWPGSWNQVRGESAENWHVPSRTFLRLSPVSVIQTSKSVVVSATADPLILCKTTVIWGKMASLKETPLISHIRGSSDIRPWTQNKSELMFLITTVSCATNVQSNLKALKKEWFLLLLIFNVLLQLHSCYLKQMCLVYVITSPYIRNHAFVWYIQSLTCCICFSFTKNTH